MAILRACTNTIGILRVSLHLIFSLDNEKVSFLRIKRVKAGQTKIPRILHKQISQKMLHIYGNDVGGIQHTYSQGIEGSTKIATIALA